jgi:hypothetical protein
MDSQGPKCVLRGDPPGLSSCGCMVAGTMRDRPPGDAAAYLTVGGLCCFACGYAAVAAGVGQLAGTPESEIPWSNAPLDVGVGLWIAGAVMLLWSLRYPPRGDT